MKRMLLIAGSAFALHGALAADASTAATTQTAKPVAAQEARETARDDAAQAAKTENARKELADLRTQMQELSRKMATLSSELGEGGPRSYAMRYLGDREMAMIGVVFGMNDGHVVVGALTPDGPAARAGLHSDDEIVAIDHQPIAVAGDVLASEAKARKLLANLKVGQSVSIDYKRGGETGVVVFPAERREAWNWPLMMNEDPEHPFLPKDFDERIRAEVERATRDAERMNERDKEHVRAEVERATRDAARVAEHDAKETRVIAERATRDATRHSTMSRELARSMAMPWWGLNLAPLNAELGRYFGTDKGVLVIAADKDSLPGIKAGDVITSIAGEPIARPEDALRALRDQETGKDVPIKLMRDRKPLALAMKAPAFNSIFNLGVPPPMPVAPAAPAPRAAPPTPPAPPAVAPAATPAPPAAPAPPPETSATRTSH